MEKKDGEHGPKENKVKKKRGRATKKALKENKRKEIEKRKEELQTLINCKSLPPNVACILKSEEKEDGYIFTLDMTEIEQLWNDLVPFVKDMLAEEICNGKVGDILCAAVSFLQYTSPCSKTANCEAFIQTAFTLNTILGENQLKSFELKNRICLLCEMCCISELNLPGDFLLNTFHFLFDLTLNENSDNDLRPEIMRMWGMRGPLSLLNLQTHRCAFIVCKLLRVVVSSAYLSCEEGRQFIAFTLTLDITLIKKFHKAIKAFIPYCKRNQANYYGEIYYTAWTNGSAEVRETLEKECIQNLMVYIFVDKRKIMEYSQLGEKVFAILSYLHQHRTIAHFSKTLTKLYYPLIWRHLRSGNNIERCNAAEVFVDIYPLENPGHGKAEESEFFIKQHNELADLLTDNCHVVRMIGIKGICNKLCTAWGTFPQETVQVLMRRMLDLANDASTYVVRCRLYDSLSVLLLNENSASYFARHLPKLGNNIHDVNEKVRCSFVKLLCAVKNMPDPAPIKYWKIVTIEHLAARLEIDGPEVGAELSRLLMSNIYRPEQSLDKFLSRLFKFIETSPKAARKLFQHSSKALDYKNAVRVMLTILVNLRAFVKRKETSIIECEENQPQKGGKRKLSRRKKSRSLQPLKKISESQLNESDGSEHEETGTNSENSSRRESTSSENGSLTEVEEYEKPGVAHALLDIVSLLFTLHSQAFNDPNNQVDHDNFIDTACAGIPLFLLYFKGTPTYYGVIHLASLVPAPKLAKVSTICSACISHLKKISEMTPVEEIKVIIHSLCSWNRFADIQDLVIDWLDQAFRCEGLNQSKALRRNVKSRKVRFVAKGGKPMLALELLDHVFSHPLNSQRVMGKSYSHVHELYIYLEERVKILIEQRLKGGLPFDSPMLSDEFLVKCLYRYSKLILLLNRNDSFTSRDSDTLMEDFDSSDVFYQYLEWSISIIKPELPQSLEKHPDLSVLLLRDVLRTAANMINIDIADDKCIIQVAGLIQDLLSSDCGLWFVGISMCVVKHIKDYTEAHYGPKDDAQLMKLILPSLLSRVFRTLSVAKYTKKQIEECVPNVNEVKTAMYELLVTLKKMYGPHLVLLHKLLKLLTDCMVAILSHDIKQLQLIETVDQVKDLPFVCNLLLSVVCRPALNSLWIATVPGSISDMYQKDCNNLAAVVSLLHTISHSKVSMPDEGLILTVKRAYSSVMAYTRDSSDEIDVKKAATPLLKDLAVFLKCTLK